MNPPIPRPLAAAALTGLLVVATGIPAAAHVTIPQSEVVSGSSATLGFRVGHGCEGAPTDRLEVQIPDGVVGAQPAWIPGWDVETEMVESEPFTLHAEEQTERVGVVRWTGGSLPDAVYHDFTIRATVLADPGTLTFPVVQGCGEAELAWIEVPAEGQDPHELEMPAPTVSVVAGDAADA